MDYRSLEQTYFEIRECQVNQFHRKFTEMDRKASKVVFDTACQAMENVRTRNRSTCMQTVSLGTGLGKSTSAYALIAAFAKQHPEFSAAYAVPTIEMAEEAQGGIEALLGAFTTILWSSCHKHQGVDRDKAMETLGHVPTRLVDKAVLPFSRIVIITHDKLKEELRTGKQLGCTTFNGAPRSIVFIDEHPELVEQVEITAERLQRFHDQLVKENPQHHWLPIVSNVVHKMSAIMHLEGQAYTTPNLLSIEEGQAFDDYNGLNLIDLTNSDHAGWVRNKEVEKIRGIIFFLQSASNGNVFYSRHNHAFFAHKLQFNTAYSGFVLLDATSDISGLVSLHPNIKAVEVPVASYENLQLLHVEMPKKFKDFKQFRDSAVKGREYGNFIKQTVLANTLEGDDVLIVTRKAVLTQELIDASGDPENPVDWSGRMVNTQNWGAGIGLNKFKNKTHVFLFGDYVMPRFANIGKTHGWLQEPLTEEHLRLAEGK